MKCAGLISIWRLPTALQKRGKEFMKHNDVNDRPSSDRERAHQLPETPESLGEKHSRLSSGLLRGLLENGYQLFDSGTAAPSQGNDL
jgi:hypothetical protein